MMTAYNICAYVPKTRAWYLLNEGQYRGIYKHIVFERGCWQFTAWKDLLSLHDFSFRSISYCGPLQHLEPDERDFANEKCIVTDDNTVYLVSLISDISCIPKPKYFKCLKLTPNNEWEFVFRSQTTFGASDHSEGIVSAAFSAFSNEMLLILALLRRESSLFTMNTAQISNLI